jgi:hypothetical protein
VGSVSNSNGNSGISTRYCNNTIIIQTHRIIIPQAVPLHPKNHHFSLTPPIAPRLPKETSTPLRLIPPLSLPLTRHLNSRRFGRRLRSPNEQCDCQRRERSDEDREVCV